MRHPRRGCVQQSDMTQLAHHRLKPTYMNPNCPNHYREIEAHDF